MTAKQEKRFVRFEYDDGSHKDFEIGRATVIRGTAKQVLFHIDRQKDGKHLMLCSEEAWPEGRKIETIRIIRENK